MGDEEIIKRRLLIDGDGTGDDRRLNLLLRNFIKWCNTNEPQNQMFFDRLMVQWSQCAFVSQKTKFALEAIDSELANYDKISKEIDRNILMAEEELKASKLNLIEARKLRKNREEYDAMAKMILEQPDRKDTLIELEKLQKEMEELHQEFAKLNNKVQKRQEKFKVLMTSLRELEVLGDDSDYTDDGDDEIAADLDADEMLEVDDGDDVDLQSGNPPKLE